MVLCVGAKRPHKNQELLVEALPELPDDVVLVLAGHPERVRAALRERARELGRRRIGVRFDRLLYDADLEGLWRWPPAPRFPTLGEGFGLPVLEAMQRGVPVAVLGHPGAARGRRRRGRTTSTPTIRRRGRRGRRLAGRSPSAGPRGRDRARARVLRGQAAARRHATPRYERASGVNHVGLNLVFLVPGRDRRHGGLRARADPGAAARARRRCASPRSSTARRPRRGPRRASRVVVPVDARQPRCSGCAASSCCCPRLARRAGVRPLHSLGSTAPARGRFRRVVTIHDLIYLVVPEAHFGLRALGHARARAAGGAPLAPGDRRLASRPRRPRRSWLRVAGGQDRRRAARPRRARRAPRRRRAPSCASGSGSASAACCSRCRPSARTRTCRGCSTRSR